MTSDSETFDAIVIGSGIGALAYGSAATQMLESRVLMLEQHFRLGGYTHTFQRPGIKGRGKFEWDVGVHYLGGMEPGRPNHVLFDFITGGMEWAKIEEPFDQFEYPGLVFNQYGNPNKFREDLTELFPDEEHAIAQYFVDIKRASTWLRTRFGELASHSPLHYIPRLKNKMEQGFCLQTAADYFDANFNDQRLKALLATPWGNCGLPPGELPFAFLAAVVQDFRWGGYYPIGGSSVIADRAVKIIEENGGSCRVNHNVTRILLDGKRAVGVEVMTKQGLQQFFAPIVVSNAGAYNTYTKFLPEGIGGPAIARDIDQTGLSTLVLYIGFKDDPSPLDFHGENHWMYAGLDHDEMAKGTLEDNITGCFLSMPSLRDRTKKRHTAEAILFSTDEPFKEWAHLSWKERRSNKSYQALKTKIAERILNFVEERHPGFRSYVEHVELSTPLSANHFTNHPRGATYGMRTTRERLLDPSLGIKTPVKGLYLVGADAYVPGVVPSLMSGLGALALQMGMFGLRKLMKRLEECGSKYK